MNTTPEKTNSAAVRSEFDKILMHHVSSLIDTREDIAALPFNLATISSLLLLAERENEIKSFPDTPPERYNRETFLADIEEIGLDLDNDAKAAIQSLDQYGFVVINDQDQYTARESASLLIMVLDAIFPQMPGMNLVAYVSQAIEEVLTGRKEHDRALRQFDQTLEKQGVRLSAVPDNKLSSSETSRILAKPPDPKVLQERRDAYLQKLKALREKSLSTDAAPSIVRGHTSLKHAKIKELFPKDVPLSEPEAAPVDSPPEETGPEPGPGESVPIPDLSSPDMEAQPLSAEAQESTPGPAAETMTPPLNADADEAAAAEVDLEEGHPGDSEAELIAEEALSKEDLVEQKIRQFEEELAMPCPICGLGKVLSDTTEKGKTYYHCSNEDCRLISWGKPYNMECPACKNPFLIEVPEPDGQIGLKCPRATCMYRKKNAAAALSGDETAPGKRKKVAVVRKKRKKGVRRVVRRKS
jgi:hypothetical protein